MASGRVASGRVADLALQARGWELVVAGVDHARAAALEPVVVSVTRVSAGRYVIELPLERPPEQIVTDLAGSGAHIISLNPLHETLEDFFVRQVTEQEQVPTSGRESA